jgi:hypothetical protein
LISIPTFSQESTPSKTVGIAAGAVYYPTGEIIGFSHSYFANYIFSKHFGLQLGVEFANGQNEDEFHFDYAQSSAIHLGLIYIPFKNNTNLQFSSSFMVLKSTNIFGTKDEILNSNSSISKFTKYEEKAYYGLNLGFQIPVYETSNFIYTSKIDCWASWLQLNAVSLNLQIQYKLSKQ